MLSFRVDAEEAAAVQRWADELGIDRSALLRDAVRRHLKVRPATPAAAGELFVEYRRRSIDFNEARNARIARLDLESP